MAIEFNCPYCTATVRVGTDSAGKIGRCPQCDTRVRIPDVRPGAGSSEATSDVVAKPQAEVAREAFPDFSKPAAPVQPTQLSADGMPIFKVPDTPVLAKYAKKKKESNWAPFIPPLIFGGLFVVIGIVYFAMTRPSFTGELIGKKLDPNQVISVSLQGNLYNIPKQPFHELVDELRERPSALGSDIANLRFDAGAGDALKISLRPGLKAELIRVPIQDLPDIQKHYDKVYSKLNDERLHELQDALNALCTDWNNAPEKEKLKTLGDYRATIGFNAFVKGLGRVCEAVVPVKEGLGKFPCVHEDSAGSLAFLVPAGTEHFIIRQRSDIKTNLFPSRFEVHVTVPLPNTNPEITSDAPIDPEKFDPIPLDESLMENKTETEEEPAMDATQSAPE